MKYLSEIIFWIVVIFWITMKPSVKYNELYWFTGAILGIASVLTLFRYWRRRNG